MPQTPSRESMIGTSFVPVASTFVRAVFFGFASSAKVQYSFGKYFLPPFNSSSPSARNLESFSVAEGISTMPV